MDDKYHIDILLDDSQLVIKMTASAAHIDEKSVAFTCEHIDLESVTDLKRLVELNLGDEALLHRELSALIN